MSNRLTSIVWHGAIGVVLFSVLYCCSVLESNSLNNPPGTELKSPLSRDRSPQVTADELDQLVMRNTQFAFDFYREVIKKGDENIFFSPYSISLALAMSYAGARGKTEPEIARTLHFLRQEECHRAFNALDLLVDSADGGAEQFILNTVNSIWAHNDYALLASYLDVLALNYATGIFRVDFKNRPERSRSDINEWVRKKTREKIQNLLPPGSISTLTRLVLTNAIYFKADWFSPFEKESTHDAPFFLLDGGTVTVPMMNQSESFPYAEVEGYYQAVELPYRGNKVSMIVILPVTGRFRELQEHMSTDLLGSLVGNLTAKNVHLSLTKTTFEWGQSLKETLSDMGMVDAFTSNADFSGIDGSRYLFISDVIHKAFVAIDEKGTEAAGATAVIMALTAAPSESIRMNVDHPFIFFIRDRVSGTVLFTGHVVDPS